jgi:hypothetical protein
MTSPPSFAGARLLTRCEKLLLQQSSNAVDANVAQPSTGLLMSCAAAAAASSVAYSKKRRILLTLSRVLRFASYNECKLRRLRCAGAAKCSGKRPCNIIFIHYSRLRESEWTDGRTQRQYRRHQQYPGAQKYDRTANSVPVSFRNQQKNTEAAAPATRRRTSCNAHVLIAEPTTVEPTGNPATSSRSPMTSCGCAGRRRNFVPSSRWRGERSRVPDVGAARAIVARHNSVTSAHGRLSGRGPTPAYTGGRRALSPLTTVGQSRPYDQPSTSTNRDFLPPFSAAAGNNHINLVSEVHRNLTWNTYVIFAG